MVAGLEFYSRGKECHWSCQTHKPQCLDLLEGGAQSGGRRPELHTLRMLCPQKPWVSTTSERVFLPLLPCGTRWNSCGINIPLFKVSDEDLLSLGKCPWNIWFFWPSFWGWVCGGLVPNLLKTHLFHQLPHFSSMPETLCLLTIWFSDLFSFCFPLSLFFLDNKFFFKLHCTTVSCSASCIARYRYSLQASEKNRYCSWCWRISLRRQFLHGYYYFSCKCVCGKWYNLISMTQKEGRRSWWWMIL